MASFIPPSNPILGTTFPKLIQVDWKAAEQIGVYDKSSVPTTDSGFAASPDEQVSGFDDVAAIVSILYKWGPIEFKVHPLNIHELDHETGTDWAHKEIVGGAIYREWVGENDEILHLRGQVFPYRIGGFSQLEAFEAQRRGGIANQLVRGKGEIMGWFVCEHLVRAHTFLSGEGIGQQVAFEAVMARCPVPDPADYMPGLWGTAPMAG